MLKQNYRMCIYLILIVSIGTVISQSDEQYKQMEQDKIYRFEHNEINAETEILNKTYVFYGSQISNPNITNIYLELEIKTPLLESNQIVFGAQKKSPLNKNLETNTIEEQYFDARGFHMRKQYYRFEVQLDQHMKPSDQYFISIIQNTPTPQHLQYSLEMIVLNQNDSQDHGKVCPFNCLGRGGCNTYYGICECNNNYVDFDCSKNSADLASLSIQQEYLQWDFYIQSNTNGKSFHFRQNHFDGFLYLQISLLQETVYYLKDQSDYLQTLEVYYSLETKKEQEIGVADRYYAKSSYNITLLQLIENSQGFELLLDEIHNVYNINDRKDTFSSNQEDQQMIFLGFRYNSNLSSPYFKNIKVNAQLVLKSGAQLNGESYNQINPTFSLKINEKVALLILILLILIIVLVWLLIYIRNCQNSLILTEKSQQSLIAKNLMKKEEEFNKYFNLITQFIFNEVAKQQYWPNLQKNSTVTESELPSCSICLCEFVEEEEVRITYCHHFFHSECLKGWVQKQKSCPFCRNDLSQDQLQQKAKSNRQSPLQIMKQILCQRSNSLMSKERRQKNGYDHQIDDIVIQLEPVQSELNVQKQEEQQQQQINLQQDIEKNEQQTNKMNLITFQQNQFNETNCCFSKNNDNTNSMCNLSRFQKKQSIEVSSPNHTFFSFQNKFGQQVDQINNS